MTALRTFWIDFEKLDKPTPLNLGCGVSAFSREEAIGLIQRYIFGNRTMPVILNIIDDVKLSDLDKKHVAPNIGSTSVRGIWFPQGYTDDID
ncbi:hypothetical protein [Sphingomonas gilva]|uniref:hypothetical protein n=1 Tax=Sphingomonas gilva TaxID=2305907 RepID=UPI0011C438B2|nr:hypothetical protein [Sphingomonas gilva]